MNIIEMVKEAHHRLVIEDYPSHIGQIDPWTIKLIERVVNLACADEREACAELMFRLDLYGEEGKAAEAIRARGTT
jgi:hypothetical protein